MAPYLVDDVLAAEPRSTAAADELRSTAIHFTDVSSEPMQRRRLVDSLRRGA